MSNTLKWLIALGVPAVLWGVLAYSFANLPNPGGNNAAGLQCRNYVVTALVSVTMNPDHTFRVTAVGAQDRNQLAELSRSSRIPDAHFLVSVTPLTESDIAKPRRILVVCDRPFPHFPERLIFSGPLDHAVGYSDGSAGRISTAEFATLDRSTFVRLDELYPPQQEREATANSTAAVLKHP